MRIVGNFSRFQGPPWEREKESFLHHLEVIRKPGFAPLQDKDLNAFSDSY